MHDEFIPYAQQSISEADQRSVSEAIANTHITRGPLVEKFEQRIADYCGASYAVAFNSGSTALLAACHVAKINRFDRLISTPNTFVATIGSAVQYGATPIFVDLDPHTANLDVTQIANAMEKPHSRGRHIIMPVHFAGVPIDVSAINNSLKDPDSIIIEDAAHALGSCYTDGSRVGCCANSQMTMFSFHPAKTITTGEGGMITTNDKNLYEALQRFRNNGIERTPSNFEEKKNVYSGFYEVQELTNNYNFTEFQAALGLSQMDRLDVFIEKRRKLVAAYRKLLKNVPYITLMSDVGDHRTAYHLFVIQIDYFACKTTREKVILALQMEGIGTQVHYIPVYRHPYFRRTCGDLRSYFPVTEKYYAAALSLPLYYDLGFEQIEMIVKKLLKILKIKK
ncbi:MAG: aminotransferase class I/II-fold pyridoxal phosphate-dependent enzyme [Parachlamydiaceae bacterium]|nr:aminotransferase class I/II-fold pyridoxal phosphate-dependent enzyme [Parachlamydiaceae bacterium]